MPHSESRLKNLRSTKLRVLVTSMEIFEEEGLGIMLEKIDHVGIAVEDLDESIKIYADLFGKSPDELCSLEVGESKDSIF